MDFDNSWPTLALAISQIHQKNASQLSFEELYRTAYTLVLRKFSKRLYEAVKEEVRKHLEEEVGNRLVPMVTGPENVCQTNPMHFLNEVQEIWSDHCLCMKLISDIMMYLDRVYSREARLPLIYDAGLTIFRDAVLRNGSIGGQVISIILAEIKKERGGEIIDRMAIKQTVLMLESLPESKLEGESIYISDLEPSLKKATEEYYQEAAAKLLAESSDASIYINKVQQWLDEEADRCNMYLAEDTTLPAINSIVEKVLIIDRLIDVLSMDSTGIAQWLDSDRYNDLELSFKLLSRVNGRESLGGLVSDKIKSVGSGINQSALDSTEQAKQAKLEGVKDKSAILSPTAISIQWVGKVLDLKDKFDKILRQCWVSDRLMESAIDRAFARFVNENARAAEFLSLFIDDHLKKSFKGKTEEEIEEILEKALVLFKFVADKDMFETYYKAHLAKRLLNNKSVSDDAERAMIAKIKNEVGTAFTSRLEGMFKDMKVSKDTMADFKSMKQAGTVDMHFDLSVNILTSTYWPQSVVSSQSQCIYPSQLEDAKSKFENFYLSRHSGRKLSWNPNLGTVDIRARFKKRTHEINLSSLAFVILMQFNELEEGQSLSYEDLKNATAIGDSELKRHLQSIAVAPRTRLLRKEPMSKNVSPGDRFYFNDKFESNMTRIKVLTISAASKVENDSERKATMEQVDQSRQYETEAAIVRIMKARKQMDHVNLVNEVIRQLSSRFKPNTTAIKHRIDALLEREYLERDAENRTLYNYLA